MNMKEKKTNRENNYDLLRIVATIAVIMIHVSATYYYAITDKNVFGELYQNHMTDILLYNTLSRFAVPCFVMLSGAFVLADERNAEYSYFYKKSFRNIGVPTIIFSILYAVYSLALAVKDGNGLMYTLKNIISGKPFYHMWYMYMLVGVYILAPILIRFKKDIQKKTFSKVTWCFLVLSCLSLWTSTHMLNWDIGVIFCYLGYFMAGYELRRWAEKKKSNIKGLCMIALGIAVELFVTRIQYGYSIQGLSKTEEIYGLVGPQCPLIVLASVLIFAGFSLVYMKKDFHKLSALTFLIYLFHAGVWDVGRRFVVKYIGIRGDCRIVIPVCILIVFGISWILSAIYLAIRRGEKK